MDRDTILVVDDVDINRGIISNIFEHKYNVIEAEDGEEAIKMVMAHEDELAIILLDVVMPNINGFQVLEKLKVGGMLNYIPVILITGDKTDEAEETGYALGALDVIMKPFNPRIVTKRVENAIDLYNNKYNLELLIDAQTQKLKKQAKELKETNYRIIDTLSTVVEFRNLESGQHITRIKSFSKILLNYVMRMYPEYDINDRLVEIISQASAMHDVGKIAISDAILLKPGRLTVDEFDIMKTHTSRGCEILETVSFIDDKEYYKYCYEICKSHHERYDGNGYPNGLKGEEIPIAAQVVSIVDVYDALVSERVYKEAYSKETAYSMILNGECGVFNPKIINCFSMARRELESMADELLDKHL